MTDSDSAGKCVLIVEDNALNMRLFSAIVAAQGYAVIQAEDALRGIDMARQEHPDLIIMDVNLPRMNGLEATRSLKDDAETGDIPIIVTTAYGLSGGEGELQACGCDGFMAKPINVGEFVDLIESLILRGAREPRFVRRFIAAAGGG